MEDFFTERAEQELTTGLRRQVSMLSATGRDQLSFRIASGAKILAAENGSFSIGKQLTVRLGTDVAGVVVETPTGKRLEVPITLEPNKAKKLTIDYNWEK